MSVGKPKVLVIVGPTAVGKSAVGVELAHTFQGEIISGDALQIYRELTIGTAKISLQEQAGIPHYLLAERSISENYTVADFKAKSEQLIADITNRQKLPIVVGGTGLYIQALLEDFQLGSSKPLPEDPRKRAELTNYAADKGKLALWERLAEQDATAANKIHPNNVKRVIRALEVVELTGKSLAHQVDQQPLREPKYDALIIGLTTERATLYHRIDQRVDQMFSNGLLQEAQLFKQERTYQAAQGIGYKEFFPYFDGECSLDEVRSKIKVNTRRYAKRQLTWFRNRMTVSWWDLVDNPEQIEQLQEVVLRWLAREEGSE